MLGAWGRPKGPSSGPWEPRGPARDVGAGRLGRSRSGQGHTGRLGARVSGLLSSRSSSPELRSAGYERAALAERGRRRKGRRRGGGGEGRGRRGLSREEADPARGRGERSARLFRVATPHARGDRGERGRAEEGREEVGRPGPSAGAARLTRRGWRRAFVFPSWRRGRARRVGRETVVVCV